MIPRFCDKPILLILYLNYLFMPRNSGLAPPVTIVQPSASAGQMLAQISRHSNPTQGAAPTWTPSTRPGFSAQVKFLTCPLDIVFCLFVWAVFHMESYCCLS